MILQRLKEFIDENGLSIASFEKSIGMSNASFGKSLKNNKAIGTDKLEKILMTYPEINPTWLLTGVGPRYMKDVKMNYPSGDTMLYNMYKDSLDHIEKQAQELGALRKENQLLEKENSILKVRVAMDAREANTAVAENASA